MQSGDHPMYASHDSYDDQLNRGLSISGNDKAYFAKARVHLLTGLWRGTSAPKRVLDFGAGDGSTLEILREAFPAAHLVAAEPSPDARRAALQRATDAGADIIDPGTLGEFEPFDLIYLNGVVHHVLERERRTMLAWLASLCSPIGQIVVFENNPWNPGARLVMRRIPFDKGVEMVYPKTLREAFSKAGFTVIESGSLFFFPRSATATPRIEQLLRRTMVGAQFYCSASARS